MSRVMQAWPGLLLCSGVVHLAAASPNCPCLSSPPAGAFDSYMIGGQLQYQGSQYPAGYGMGSCQAYDDALQPYCADAEGNALANRPEWCQESWCWVDTANCDLPLTFKSSFFPDSDLSFSYQTCGAVSTFQQWFGSGAAGSTHSVKDLAGLVEDYVTSVRRKLESSAVEFAGTTDSCPIKSSCPCTTCTNVPNGWGDEQVDFSSTVFLKKGGDPAPESTCLASVSDGIFTRVAAKEYDDSSRLGFIYQGLQKDGSYSQWPAQEWCSSTYDPRFRPWYSIAASGTKDVVLLIDVSGSMSQQNRIGLAQQAVKGVLDTLTWQDRVSIVTFSDRVDDVSGILEPVTDATRAKLIRWTDDNVQAAGGTNFKAPLERAISILAESSVSCSKVILFLTDGEAEFGEDDFDNTKAKAEANDIIIFGFALGSGAQRTVTKRLACENSGVFHAVNDGADLNNAMSSYFTLIAAATSNSIRWVEYNEVATVTKQRMLAGCQAMYDKSDLASEVNILLGVVCIDINMMVDLDDLQTQDGYDDFNELVKAETRQCSVLWAGKSELQRQAALEIVRANLISSGAETCDGLQGLPVPALVEGLEDLEETSGLSSILVGVISAVVVLLFAVACYCGFARHQKTKQKAREKAREVHPQQQEAPPAYSIN